MTSIGALTQAVAPRFSLQGIPHLQAIDINSEPFGSRHRTKYGYDLAGARTSKRDGKGQVTTFAYDAARRLETITYDDGTTAAFAYDGRGNRTIAENADSHRAMTYDVLGRLDTVLDQETGRTLRYSYDEAGNRTSMTVEPDGLETRYLWDLRGQLSRLTDPDGGEYRFAHDAAGRRTLTTHPNGIRRADAYDESSRVTAVVYTSPRRDVLESFAYEMDEAGNRLSKTFEDGGREQYGYDDLDRLISATYPSGRAVQYLYDAVGNRLRLLEDGVETTYGYNAFNQLLDATDPDGTTLFTWDDNGNQTARTAPAESTEYTWDARDRLSEIALPDGTKAAYGYDTENLRVAMDDAGGARRILLDGLEEWGEVHEGSGDLEARFDHDPTRIDALLAQATDAHGRAAMLTDALGSVYGIADDAPTLRARYSYDVYGARTATLEEVGTRWGFTGRTRSTGGATYSRTRWRSSTEDSSWLGADPIGVAAGPNRYSYVGQAPTTWIDPLGLQSMHVCWSRAEKVARWIGLVLSSGASVPLELLGIGVENPKTGTPYDHVTKHRNNCQGLLNRINELTSNCLTPIPCDVATHPLGPVAALSWTLTAAVGLQVHRDVCSNLDPLATMSLVLQAGPRPAPLPFSFMEILEPYDVHALDVAEALVLLTIIEYRLLRLLPV